MSHIYGWECGNYAAVAGLAVRLVQGDEGIVPAERLEAAIRAPNVHYAPARLACLENTHNNACGSAWTPAEVEAFAAAARRHGLAVHLDGARVFNAAVALGVDVRQYARCVDSVMFCVSKGLSAPVGSLLCGSRAFVDRASGMRKRLGGAMRQAGVIAAAGIVALERMVDRLAVDHAHCRALATGLAAIPGLEVLQAARPTNILQLDVSALGWRAAELIDRWVPYGIRCNPRPPTRVRLVTHRHIDDADVEYVLAVTRRLVTAA
jgi:threonine aldolase